jgi:dolichyl-phosphate-mannose--protein O-mannosyl transferase
VGGVHLAAGPEEIRGRRIAVALFIAAAAALAVLFFPVWSGMPVAEWFWRAHLWLPGWN